MNKFDNANEYYVVRGWFEGTHGLYGGSFYGAVATPDDYLRPRRVVLIGEDAIRASEAAARQPAGVDRSELMEDSDGQYGDALNPREREDTQSLLLDKGGEDELSGCDKQVLDEIIKMGGKYSGGYIGLRLMTDQLKDCLDKLVRAGYLGLKDGEYSVIKPVTEMVCTGAIGADIGMLGMPDRGGHGRIDNLGPKRVRTGRNRKNRNTLTGFTGNGPVPTISQTGGRRGGR